LVVNIYCKGSLIWFWTAVVWLLESVFLVGIDSGAKTVVWAETVLVLVALLVGTYLVYVLVYYVNSWDWLVLVVGRVR
jgi:hypothetical protein